MAYAPSRSRLNCAKNEEEDDEEEDEKDDGGGGDDVSRTEIILCLTSSPFPTSSLHLGVISKGEKEGDEMEGRIEWHLLPSLTFYYTHTRSPLPLGASEQNICGQNSALERSNLRDGGGDISHSKLRAMRSSA